MLIDAEVLHRSCVDLHRSILKMDMVRCAFFKSRCDNIFPNSYWKESKNIMNIVQRAAKTWFPSSYFHHVWKESRDAWGWQNFFQNMLDSTRKTSRKGPVQKKTAFSEASSKTTNERKKSKCSTVIVLFVPILVVHFGGGHWRT